MHGTSARGGRVRGKRDLARRRRPQQEHYGRLRGFRSGPGSQHRRARAERRWRRGRAGDKRARRVRAVHAGAGRARPGPHRRPVRGRRRGRRARGRPGCRPGDPGRGRRQQPGRLLQRRRDRDQEAERGRRDRDGRGLRGVLPRGSRTDAEPGTVMAIGCDGRMAPSREAYDRRVAGIVTGAGDLRPGIVLGHQDGPDGPTARSRWPWRAGSTARSTRPSAPSRSATC